MSLVVQMLAKSEIENNALRAKLEAIAKEADRAARAIGPSARRGDQSVADTFRWIRDTATSIQVTQEQPGIGSAQEQPGTGQAEGTGVTASASRESLNRSSAPTQTAEQAAKVYANGRAVERDVSIGSMTWSEYKNDFLAGWNAAQAPADSAVLVEALEKIQGGELTVQQRRDREFLDILVDTMRAYARDALAAWKTRPDSAKGDDNA